MRQVTYAAHGAESSGWLGNNIARTVFFNSRLQPRALWDALNNNPNQFLFIQNPICWESDNDPNNCDTSAKPNGNMYGALTYQGGPGPSGNLSIVKQGYSYDGVNRLQTASDTGGWSRTFSYDQYGNQWISGSSGITPSPLSPQAGRKLQPCQ
jgi:hypothetical protein